MLDDFYDKYQNDTLVVDKWFFTQAISVRMDCLMNVKKLMQHPAFSIKNPNKVRSLIGAFANFNHYRFHDKSGEGYRFLADQILNLDPINQQIAARMTTPMMSWKRYDLERQELMKEELKRIIETPGLSSDVYEIVSKIL